MEYLPVGIWESYALPPGITPDPDAFLLPVSPPDDKGFCSFGPGVWMSGTLVRGAKQVIAEVQPDFIRTYGENYIHIDQIDWLVEGQVPTGAIAAPEPNDEDVATVEAICTQVAVELVNDGDTLQMGVGRVSASLGRGSSCVVLTRAFYGSGLRPSTPADWRRSAARRSSRDRAAGGPAR